MFCNALEMKMKDFLFRHSAASGIPAPFEVPRIAAIGVFDGVHSGHQEIIRSAATVAENRSAIPLALSFSPHPRQLLTPGEPPQLLLPENERIKRLCRAGAKECAFINFTHAVASLEPEEFLQALAENTLFRIAGICVGEHWKFGRNGSGDGKILHEFCAKHNWIYRGIPELCVDGEIVSSTALRRAAVAGDLEKFRRFCGSEVTLYGKVVHGFAIAGSELDAPTANLECDTAVPVPDGVYAGSTIVDGTIFPAAVNIGFAPTFGGSARRVEIHLIGFSGTLYGKTLAVKLHRFIRPERKFATPAELKTQIAADITEIFRIEKQSSGGNG